MFSRETQVVFYCCLYNENVVFHSVQVILNGKKLVLKNVRYPDEIGIYQCEAENPHGMIVSSTYVNVLGKHLENCINSKISTLDNTGVLDKENLTLQLLYEMRNTKHQLGCRKKKQTNRKQKRFRSPHKLM